jgi:hypothetical protein
MKEIIEKLADSLIQVSDDSFQPSSVLPANLQDDYRYFLSLCDGGYTPDHFFHFFGQKGPRQHNLLAWNETELWKKYYGLDEKTFVFAEDILGTQFCFDIRGNRRAVKMLIPGDDFTLCANTFEQFVATEVICESRNAEVRQLVKRFFETKGESFRPFTHIACKIPPALGGSDSDLDNLELTRASTNLKLIGQVTMQVKKLAPGTRIREVKVDRDKEEITLVPESPNWLKKLF